jgi:hypothetical protein
LSGIGVAISSTLIGQVSVCAAQEAMLYQPLVLCTPTVVRSARIGWHAQLRTTVGATRVIVGVDVVNSGGDRGQMTPMVQQVEQRYRQRPREYLADGGFATKDDITQSENDCTSNRQNTLSPLFWLSAIGYQLSARGLGQ